ncbi:MAG: HAMP domain-containing protein [Nitrospiraceae bacterium]|nr:MAG: HAMP domain-containing protein [Nitrospiraceae bacterium]
MMLFFNNLQRKMFLITSIIIFVLVSLLFYFEYSRDKRSLYNQIVTHMKENSFTIRNSIESVRIPMLIQAILEEYAENILRYKDPMTGEKHDPFEISPHEIHVVNKESIIMASTRSELIGRQLEEALGHREEGMRTVLKGKASYSVEQMEHSGVRVIDVSVPIRHEGMIIGVLHYVEPYVKLEAMFRESFLHHLIFALVMIIFLSLFLNLFINKMVIKPIQDLSGAMDRITVGGTGDLIPVTTEDEIGRLAGSFNDMSQALNQREKELKEYTVKLEDMVDERTKKLRESQDQLVQTEKLASMGKLAGYIAHEINNPIGIIVSRAECILMDAAERHYPDSLLRDIDVIKKHANRIASITKGMLTFSRKSPGEFRDVDINSVIAETLLLFEKQFLMHDIKIDSVVDNSFPAISGNSTQLQQVFFNIFSNALDVLQDGGDIKIRSYTDSDGMVHITVSDNGPGIPQEHMDKIFEPFFTTKQEKKGTGLGLSVTYGIIKDHHGQIKVHSNKDEGTTFEILLPLKKMCEEGLL